MDRDSNEIREEINATRAELGETVEALSYKTDFRARLDDAVSDRMQSAKDRAYALEGAVFGAVIDGLAAVLQNPLALLGGVFAAGMLVGWVLPSRNGERK